MNSPRRTTNNRQPSTLILDFNSPASNKKKSPRPRIQHDDEDEVLSEPDDEDDDSEMNFTLDQLGTAYSASSSQITANVLPPSLPPNHQVIDNNNASKVKGGKSGEIVLMRKDNSTKYGCCCIQQQAPKRPRVARVSIDQKKPIVTADDSVIDDSQKENNRTLGDFHSCDENADDNHEIVVVDGESDEQNRDCTLPVAAAAARTTSNTASGDVCFICGTDLTKLSGWKGRLNHIKRCSKKHGVSGRDVRLNDDLEAFVPQSSPRTTIRQNKTSSSKNNPYLHQNAKWHGDSEEDLKLAVSAAMSTKTSPDASVLESESVRTVSATKSPKQTSMKSFFGAPRAQKSVNSVLLAGAKRMAKTAKILTEAKNEKKPDRNNNGRFRNAKRQRRQSYSNDRNPNTCPTYKKITGTDFVCDGFMYANPVLTKNYFLTHFHSDHYGGISSNWDAGIIYCSMPTANLVSQQLGVPKTFLHPLPMETPTVIASKGRPVTVTLFDANHCPGAVMFLFEIGKRRMLHVGDFRWHHEAMMKHAALKAFSTLQVRLNELYLDTTYCDPKYKLPSQAEAIAAAVEVAEREVLQARRTKRRVLFLFGAYTIGKERIYVSVAERLRKKVYVDKSRYRILSNLGWSKEGMAIFTTVKENTNLWVVPLGHVNFKKMEDYAGGSNKVFSSRKFHKVVGFRPTGWTMTAASKNGNGSIVSSQTRGDFSVHGVPYSEHSSFPELVDCVASLKPVTIIPTVSAARSKEQVDLILNALHGN